MDKVIRIGLDLAKTVFQVHGVDASDRVVVRRQLRRSEVRGFFANLPPCLVGIEACGSAHYWARVLRQLGHTVRLLAASDVKPYVKRGKKNDATDAAAICEAVGRPHLRFVPIKTAEQQAVLVLHRARSLLVGQRTELICAARSHLAEFGIVAGQGKGAFNGLVELVRDGNRFELPELALHALRLLSGQIDELTQRIKALEEQIVAWHRRNEASRRLETIPGVGPLTASAIVATVGDARRFETGRHFAAWLGLVPGQNSTGGKATLGRITKTGDRYLRTLLVIGATGTIRYAREKVPGGGTWLAGLLARKGKAKTRLVTVALANKTARIAWALLTRGEIYQAPAAA
jgi:transposase